MSLGRLSFGRDAVLYVGLDDKSAGVEADGLRKVDPALFDVRDAKPSNLRNQADDSYFISPIGIKGHSVDLTTKSGRGEFVAALGVSKERGQKIAQALAKAPDNTRDELARIAVAWAGAERDGGRVPSRLVISGHSDGSAIWGSQSESAENLTPQSLRLLAEAMPHAAAQVEDLALSACSCGGNDALTEWREAFPNLKTALAYRTASPNSDQGSVKELQTWEQFTRGSAEVLDAKRFNPNAATWSVRNGYLTPKTVDVAKAKSTAEALRPVYLEISSGKRPLDSGAKTLINNYRTALREIAGAGSSEVPLDERSSASQEAQRALRLVHFDDWKDDFAKANGPVLAAAYQKTGLQPPNPSFDKMTRQQANAECKRLSIAIRKLDIKENINPALAPALNLMRGLQSLDPAVIQSTWITRQD
jgi:hypothetical protein